MTITTVTLIHKYGTSRECNVLRVDHDGFVIRWGFQEYHLHVKRNKLVRIHGNRITKQFNWSADNIEELREFHTQWLKNSDHH